MMKYLFLLLLITLGQLGFAQRVYNLKIKVVHTKNNQVMSDYLMQINNDTLATDENGLINYKTQKSILNIQTIDPYYSFDNFSIEMNKDTFFTLYIKVINSIKTVTLKGSSNKAIISRQNSFIFSQRLLENITVPISTNDPIHLLKTLPGVSTSQELNSGLSIRGANAYNTSYYLDNIPVPNASHSFGLFSYFNLSTIRQIEYFGYDAPSSLSGRGSSIIKFYLKNPEQNKNNYDIFINPFLVSGSADINLKKDKLGVFVNFRKSILNQQYNTYVIPLFSNFYDGLVKVKYNINKRTDLKLIAMQNKDAINARAGLGLAINDSIEWKFKAYSAIFTKLKLNGSVVNIEGFYKNYSINKIGTNALYKEGRSLDEINLKYIFEHKVNVKKEYNYGAEMQYFVQKLNFIDSTNQTTNQSIASVFGNYKKRFSNWTYNLNPRLAYYSNIGKVYLESHNSISLNHKKWNPYLSLNNYYNNIQYVMNNLISTSLDLSFLSNRQQEPFNVYEALLGVKSNNKVGTFQFTGFYRNFRNSFDTRSAVSNNWLIDNDLVKTKSWSYGLEVFSLIPINKNNSINVNYTYSRVFSQSNELNLGIKYPANYDRPHILNALYQFKYKRLQLTGQFTLQSGRAITVPLFVAGITPFYSLRNEYRLPLFHKLDLGFQYNITDKPKFKQILQLHIYNVYARKNIYAIVYHRDNLVTVGSKYEIQYLSLFPFLPSFSYQIKF